MLADDCKLWCLCWPPPWACALGAMGRIVVGVVVLGAGSAAARVAAVVVVGVVVRFFF